MAKQDSSNSDCSMVYRSYSDRRNSQSIRAPPFHLPGHTSHQSDCWAFLFVNCRGELKRRAGFHSVDLWSTKVFEACPAFQVLLPWS